MERNDFVLTCLALGGQRIYSPVQLQKLFFLIDRKIPGFVEGPRFHFIPYDYGPFDAEIYSSLEVLSGMGLVHISASPNFRWRTFQLTELGMQQGLELSRHLDARASDYIKRLVEFITSLSFAQLVGTIYREYPEMRANSVFRDQ